MNLDGFIGIAENPTFLKLKGILFFVFIILSFIIVIYAFINQSIKRKAYRRLDLNQQKILRKGRILMKKYKLLSLFTSVGGAKPTKVGGIEAYIEMNESGSPIENNEGKLIPTLIKFAIFATRKSLISDYRFYKVPVSKIEDYKDGIDGDVRINEWNFILSKKTGFFEVNKNKAYDYKIDLGKNDNIDVMKEVGKSVIAGILSDPQHRKEVRRAKLLKLPNSEMGT